MNRTQVVVLIVTVLSVAGLAIAAATVSTPSSSSPGTGPGDDSGGAQDQQQQQNQEKSDVDGSDDLLLVGLVVFLFSMLAVLYVLVQAFNLRRAVVAVLLVVVVSLVGLLVWGLLMNTVPSLTGGEGSGPVNQTTSTGGGGSGGRTPVETPRRSTDVPFALLGVFGLALLVLVTAIYRYSGSDTEVTGPSEEESDDEDNRVREVGEAAGRAAARIEAEGGDLENAIYRAWKEMTDALDVESPRTTTPEEFADRAVEAGMSPDDVQVLTRIFEEVRYGDAPPSEERERRAQDALRRIQDAYTGGESDE